MKSKKIIAFFASLLIVFSVNAQTSKLTNSAQILFAKHANAARKQHRVAAEQRTLATILLSEDADVTDSALEALDIEVVKRRGTVVFVNVPISRLEALAQIEGIKTIHAGGSVRMKNDYARKNTMVDNVHAMNTVQSASADVPEKYRGKGVLVSVIDAEIDFAHPAFRNADGTSRIKELVYNVSESAPSHFVVYKDDKVEEGIKASLERDEEVRMGHGAHVAGIAAGSTDLLAVGDPNKQYYGMAPEADILAYDLMLSYTGTYDDSDVLLNLTRAFDKADELHQPVVVNLSIGVNSPQLDGTDFFSEGLRELMKNYDMRGKVVCVAAGNEGGQSLSVQIDCEQPIVNDDWTMQKLMYFDPQFDRETEGLFSSVMNVFFYGNDDREFAVKYLVVDDQNRMLASTDKLTPASVKDLKEPIALKGVSNYGNDFLVELFPTFKLTSTNRLLHETEFNGRNLAEPMMIVAALYTKSEGMHIDGAVENNAFTYVPDDPDIAVPNNFGSLNPMACTDNVISVGSYTNRYYFTTIDDEIGDDGIESDEEPGELSEYSSFSTSFYGTARPDVVAPGRMLISSYHQSMMDGNVVSISTYNGTDCKWGCMSGTSMATPAVSGIIALWLQADPTLTTADVRNIIRQTSDYDSFCEAKPERAGYGKINALRGLEYILSTTGIQPIGSDIHRTTKRLDPRGNIVIEKNGQLYNIIGTRVAR